VLLLPIGLDETRVGRVPWMSIAILALNVVAFAATSLSHDEELAEARFRDVVAYWRDHPYLTLPAEMERRFGLTGEKLARRTGTGPPAAAPAGTEAMQARLDALCEELIQAVDDTPERRWSLVPARGLAQPGWVTHQFLHGGLGHLVGNMLVLALVVAPFLEDAWGPLFFLAFYLTGGIAAGAAQALPMGDSPVHILGASGAISACLGAFALRFAHRRVRIFYWFVLVVRGTFFVPAWLYAFLGLGADLLGLAFAGTGASVAYAAHVGGFAFGLGAALVMRATGLDDRLAPEGTARRGRTLSASRAQDALADGRMTDARRHLEDALRRDPSDAGSMLDLARLHASALERDAATALVERLVGLHLAAGDRGAAEAVVTELGDRIDPALLRPAAAYRMAELSRDPAVAERLDEVAAQGGGALAAKALLRSAERARASDPARARALGQRASGAEGASPELRARAEALVRECTPAPDPERAPPEPGPGQAPAGSALGAEIPVRLVHCRLVGSSEAGLDLATEEGKRALLAPRRVAAVAAGVVAEHTISGRPVRNAVLLDLLLHPRDGERRRTIVRLAGHEMALAAIHPGVPAAQAYASVVDALLEASGAAATPSAAAAAGRPFARYGSAAAFEAASWGRALTA
jgi:membrane associated rhomboid family serine protease